MGKTRKGRSGPATGGAAANEGGDVGRLLRENETLRKELAGVVANASENEKIWRHFAAVERVLFRTRELERMVEELLREVKERFGTGLLVLYLSHPEAVERLFQGESGASLEKRAGTWISPLDVEEARSLFGQALKPVLFTAGGKGYLEMLSESCRTVRSGALIPLKIGEVLFGALLLGSPDPGRYNPGDATDLLEQLGVNIALSMDNCLTYEKVREFSVRDQLTGLYNFFQIHTVLDREFRKARRSCGALSILLIDLNYVQNRDEFESGVDVLKHAAGILEGILPKDDCYTGRYGSDEFLVVLPGVPEDEAREVAPYISSAMRKSPFRVGNTAILITAVIGIGTYGEDTTNARDLVDAAYAELCAVKLEHADYRTVADK